MSQPSLDTLDRVWCYFRRHQTEHGHPPTTGEAATALGMSSRVVRKYLVKLHGQDRIAYRKGDEAWRTWWAIGGRICPHCQQPHDG